MESALEDNVLMSAEEYADRLIPFPRLSGELKEVIFEWSKNNPLYLKEFLRHIMNLEKGLVQRLGNFWYPTPELVLEDLPRTLNDMILRRVKEELSENLDLLLHEHDLWQVVDGDIRRIDSLTEKTFDELVDSWVDLKKLAQPLYIGKNSDWAQTLAAAESALNDAHPSSLDAMRRRLSTITKEDLNGVLLQATNVTGALNLLCEGRISFASKRLFLIEAKWTLRANR